MRIPQYILDGLSKLVADLAKYIASIPLHDIPPPEIPKEIPKPEPPKIPTLNEIAAKHPPKWCGGTLEERRSMILLKNRVCKEEGLSISLAADLHATIWGESGWNQWCVNPTSKDYGLCQFSYKYYLVEYKMTPVEALLNPEKCLRIMARNFKAGRQRNWVAYKPNDATWQVNRLRGL